MQRMMSLRRGLGVLAALVALAGAVPVYAQTGGMERRDDRRDDRGGTGREAGLQSRRRKDPSGMPAGEARHEARRGRGHGQRGTRGAATRGAATRGAATRGAAGAMTARAAAARLRRLAPARTPTSSRHARAFPARPLTVLLGYRSDRLNIPGTGSSASVNARIIVAPAPARRCLGKVDSGTTIKSSATRSPD